MTIRRLLATTLLVLALAMHHACAGDSAFIDKPGLDRTAYTRVMAQPCTIFISPDSEYQGLDADELKALADTFREVV